MTLNGFTNPEYDDAESGMSLTKLHCGRRQYEDACSIEAKTMCECQQLDHVLSLSIPIRHHSGVQPGSIFIGLLRAESAALLADKGGIHSCRIASR